MGRLALHYAEENPDEVLAALDHKTEAVIRELEAQHKEARRSLRRRRDRARGPPTLPMRFVIMHKTNADWEAGAIPSRELIARVGTLLGELGNARRS